MATSRSLEVELITNASRLLGAMALCFPSLSLELSLDDFQAHAPAFG
jgi:hypothetical protein